MENTEFKNLFGLFLFLKILRKVLFPPLDDGSRVSKFQSSLFSGVEITRELLGAFS